MAIFTIILSGEQIVGFHLPNGNLESNEKDIDVPVTLVDENQHTDTELFSVADYLKDKKVVADAFVFSQEAVDALDLKAALTLIAVELPKADINIYYHEDTDTRKIGLEADWRTYRKELRAYVTDGVIVGSEPVAPT